MIQGDQRGDVCSRRMSHHKDRVRISSELSNVIVNPPNRASTIIHERRKRGLRVQTIVGQNRHVARSRKCRPYEAVVRSRAFDP